MPQGAPGGFPLTRHSVIEAMRGGAPDERRRAFGTLVAAYWKPVYKYLRLKWRISPEDAEDLTQGFFARALEKGFFDRYDQARARFRTFLRTCLDGFVANERKAARRLKRGGGVTPSSLDFPGAERELGREPAAPADLDALFQREWVASVFSMVVESLKERCVAAGRATDFALFSSCDLEGSDGAERPSYAELAQRFGLPLSQVTNRLAAARRQFRAIVLETLRELTASEDEFRSETRQLLGIDPP